MIDREIQQRVKRLTADELPMLQHKSKSGNVMAQTTLGLVYREGVHRKVDVQSGKVTRYQSSNPKAVSWLAKAADGGFPVAQVELGEMYYSGHGLDRDLEMARYWFTKAEQVNYPRAKLNLLQLDFENGTVNSRPADLFKGLLESTLAPLRQQHRDRHLP
jgi:TPR repeat protein